jgi:hypothetical protein
MRSHTTIWTLLVSVVLLAGCAFAPRTPVQEQLLKPTVTVLGEWKEHWGNPLHTDVKYFEQYRITQASGRNVKVQVLNRDQKIDDEQFNGTVLTFSHHTDAYVVKYSLTLQQDGRWLIGTATTPKKVVDVKWEKMK